MTKEELIHIIRTKVEYYLRQNYSLDTMECTGVHIRETYSTDDVPAFPEQEIKDNLNLGFDIGYIRKFVMVKHNDQT